jgi:NitT/TauT family transport system ATP-binding protein
VKTLRLHAVSHAFGARGVLDGIELALDAGRTLALVGPSGCGKTTLLNLVAGLVPLQEGRIASGFTRSACMFQQPRLLPWRRALANVALGLQAQGVARAERERRATALALRMGLAADDLRLYPSALSGGMQSRAALARALLVEPDLLLLDEPFSALDIGLKAELHALLLAEQQRLGTAVLLVTHDLAEALRLADEVAVLAVGDDGGRIVWQGLPLSAAAPAVRGDGWVARAQARLIAEPVVRAAFGLPPAVESAVDDSDGVDASAARDGASARVLPLDSGRRRRHAC